MSELFDPKGEISRREMIHAGIAQMQPLEPGTLITFDMISEWIGEEFPIIRESGNGKYFTPDTGPFQEVRGDLHSKEIHLTPVANLGWVVTDNLGKVVDAEDQSRRAIRALKRSIRIARSVDGHASPEEKARAVAVERDAREQMRVLRAQAKARAKEASRWD